MCWVSQGRQTYLCVNPQPCWGEWARTLIRGGVRLYLRMSEGAGAGLVSPAARYESMRHVEWDRNAKEGAHRPIDRNSASSTPHVT